eukprot:CAMPEP_0174370442 /NCGR_PEP_ID=MMETSP0811_2-20130205/96132_1 /TAXON_ID=73025 ORGANISM="Eutreptiella gymnastica-like, Strain CCMP1594" /NCGR_SAMPLE_ID=MMETSP0811_2 /ASSEMBLY_ACC=CAM_ASM_000667 /LENGTH=143 /DNA_ID=CAMNT_0015515861 /DNA_START=74 /DNA_END=506 /DNA_ORIENTATION=-
MGISAAQRSASRVVLFIELKAALEKCVITACALCLLQWLEAAGQLQGLDAGECMSMKRFDILKAQMAPLRQVCSAGMRSWFNCEKDRQGISDMSPQPNSAMLSFWSATGIDPHQWPMELARWLVKPYCRQKAIDVHGSHNTSW